MAAFPSSDSQAGLVKRIIFLSVVAVILAAIGFVHWIKESDAFKTAEAFIRQNPEIKGVVGEVKECGLGFPFDIKTSNGKGRASFALDVEGTKGSTTASVSLTKRQGQWQVVSADYEDREGRKKPLIKKEATPAHLSTAHNYFRQKDFDKAIEAYNESIRLQPGDHRAYYWRGRAYAEKKQTALAVTDFRKVIELKQDEASAYDWLGWLAIQEKKYDEAILHLTKSIELKPDRGWAYYNRGRCYYQKGDRGKALQDAKKSCDLGHKEGCMIYENLKKK